MPPNVLPGRAVGVLATEGTVASELYQRALQELAIEPVLPDRVGQEQVMQAIRWVKAGGPANLEKATEPVRQQAAQLARVGAGAILLGCTDLSVILRDGDLAVPIIDSTVALAEQIVAAAMRPSLG